MLKLKIKKFICTVVALAMGISFLMSCQSFPLLSSFDKKFKKISSENQGPAVIDKYKGTGDLELWVKVSRQVKPTEKEQHFNVVLNYLKSLLSPAHEPYFGAVPAGAKTCDLLPLLDRPRTVTEDGEIFDLKLPANFHHNYGSCEYSDEGFSSELSLIYCRKEETFLQLKLFSKTKDLNLGFSIAQLCGWLQ